MLLIRHNGSELSNIADQMISKVFKTQYLLSLLLIYSCQLLNSKQLYVEPGYTNGRFGDHLVAFAHALYFAHKHGCHLISKPFQYSDQLKLHKVTTTANLAFIKQYQRKTRTSHSKIYKNNPSVNRKITLERLEQLDLAQLKSNTLIEVPYFPEVIIEHALSSTKLPYFIIDWEDPAFKEQLKLLIKPNKALQLIKPLPHKISIAVHVRNGGNYDDVANLQSNLVGLYKLPFIEYYINQIKIASELLGHRPIYIFIFTDALNPQQLTAEIAAAVNLPNIEFDCRKNLNSDTNNVLEDFFSMQAFDALIRPASNFSLMAEKLSNYTFVIYPGAFMHGLKIQTGIINIRKSLSPLLSKAAV